MRKCDWCFERLHKPCSHPALVERGCTEQFCTPECANERAADMAREAGCFE